MTLASPEIRVALVGFGAINRHVAQFVRSGGQPVRLVAVATRGSSNDDSLPGIARLRSPTQLAEMKPDLVVEAAGREAVLPWGLAALQCGASFIVSSSSALADDDVLERLSGQAAAAKGGLIISPGAASGIEALAAASRSGLDHVLHKVIKPPQGWRNTAAERYVDLCHLRASTTFYRGSARDVARLFPSNANATVATAISGGLGLDGTHVELIADPEAETNRHVISASGSIGTFSIESANRPLPSNPKSSELAALALVRLIENSVAGVRI